MRKHFCASATSVIGFLALGCGGGASGEPAKSPEGEGPGDAATAMKREMEPLGKQPVASKDQGWKAEVEGLSPPKMARQDNRVSLTIDIGLEAPLECSVFDEIIDTGTSVSSVLAAIGKNVEVKAVAPYSFQMIDDEPAMFVRAVYGTTVEGEQRVGDLKFMVSPRQQHSYVCSLDAPGHAESFVRIASEFGRSFQSAGPAPAFQRQEVWKVSLGDTPIGFTASRLLPGKAGRFTNITLSTMLIPASPQELKTQDEAIVVVRDAKGTVMEGKWISIENLQTEMEIDLAGGPGAYQYSGTFKGKPVSGKVSAAQLVDGQVPLTDYAKRVSRGQKVKPIELTEYHPSLDPTKGTSVKYTGTPREGGASLIGELGSVTLEFQADGEGTMRTMSADMAGAKLTGELVYEKGKL